MRCQPQERRRPRHPPHGMFARNATGLVRGVSPRSSLIINFIPGHPAQSLAAGFFFVFALFPGGNYLVGLLLVIPMGLAMSYAFGLLTAMIPRSGGDYMLVSRVIHPMVGLISSFCMTLAGLLSNAFFGIAFVTIGLAPGLRGSASSAAGRRSSSGAPTSRPRTGTIALGGLMMCLSALILAGGWGWTLRVQNIALLAGHRHAGAQRADRAVHVAQHVHLELQRASPSRSARVTAPTRTPSRRPRTPG